MGQFSFQILPGTSDPSRVCAILWSVCDLDGGLLFIQFSESLICWWGAELYMQSPGALAFINTFVLLSWISLPSTFGFPEASLFIPLAKRWRFSYSMLSCPSLPVSRPTDRRIMQKGTGSLHSLGTRAPLIWEKRSSLSFGSCQLLLRPLPPQPRGCLGVDMRENEH